MEQSDSITRDIVEAVAGDISSTNTELILEIIEDDTITDKKTAIATLLKLGYCDTRYVGFVLAGYNLK